MDVKQKFCHLLIVQLFHLTNSFRCQLNYINSREYKSAFKVSINTCSAVNDKVGKANKGLGIANWCPRAATGVGFVISGILPDVLPSLPSLTKWFNRICSLLRVTNWWPPCTKICSWLEALSGVGGDALNWISGLHVRTVVGVALEPWASCPGLWVLGEASFWISYLF